MVKTMFFGKGNTGRFFTGEELSTLCLEGLQKQNFAGQRVLAIIPDSTRSGPIGLLFRAICTSFLPEAKKLDFLIALGTHPVMPEEKVNQYLCLTESERRGSIHRTRGRHEWRPYPNVRIFQHRWDVPEELSLIGTITASEIAEISGNLLAEDIPVTINKRVLDYDRLLLVGPVFPHEVVGFSGGSKYLFPGIAGPQFLHQFHWLGALITNPKINGTKDTPVRRAINKAVSFLNLPITNLCYVVKDKKVYGIYVGDQEAWSQAADLSACLNIHYVSKSFHTVLSMAPAMYDDIWTAGKCMYKLEPVVANKGKLIIYAPHITEVSYTHGENLMKVGYHTRDYFLKQTERFKNVPGAIKAHSTHVKGIGTYREGVEKPRIEVILATGIPESVCRKINLGYLNYREIKVEDYANREEEGILLVRDAGEVLFRLSDGSVPDIDKI